ncbi:GNAT family N-acetyltransferase [Paeniglutamicibacter cryotolerans]|uniref:Putative acetyltransferase n=1 Tax=Paeniglutamicibacter cryotolerans TaxID=670079 RepID=A0A839QKT7_9MICC|nr:GNAT family N-acetyltransferase [Paeniglutamicibacter cryotolerans]MBB2996819.1 putative acetyltransferase [Paeniglutamicibacter cryotolerans]
MRLERFTPSTPEGDAASGHPARTLDWLNAARRGFYDKPLTEKEAAAIAGSYQADGRELTAVYDDAAVAPGLGAEIPVATYASFTRSLNTGARLIDAHLVTMVTVRPTHRRRGILSRMITADLAQAKERGLFVAALHASEGGIYGRFGFGRATEAQDYAVDVRGGLPMHAPVAGSVVQVQPARLGELIPEVFSRFHAATRGSVDRQRGYLMRGTGAWSDDGFEPDTALRAAVFHDAAGTAQGYVTYVFDGWDAKVPALSVRDLVAATAQAYRELWRFLGDHDLIETVNYHQASVADPLPWFLSDARRVSASGRGDRLWLRILDVPGALGARSYVRDGTLVLTVRDRLSLTTGSYRLQASGGVGTITTLTSAGPPSAEAADGIELDIADLSSLYLGSVRVADLLAAGRLAGSPAAAARAVALFDGPGAPYCITGF